MTRTKKLAMIALVALFASIGVQDVAFAQTPNVAIQLTATEMLTVVGVGAFGGLLHAWQIYRTGQKDFDTLVFIDNVINCVIGSVPFAIAEALGQSVTGAPLNVFTYVAIFFASIGLGSQIKLTLQPTVPSQGTS